MYDNIYRYLFWLYHILCNWSVLKLLCVFHSHYEWNEREWIIGILGQSRPVWLFNNKFVFHCLFLSYLLCVPALQWQLYSCTSPFLYSLSPAAWSSNDYHFFLSVFIHVHVTVSPGTSQQRRKTERKEKKGKLFCLRHFKEYKMTLYRAHDRIHMNGRL